MIRVRQNKLVNNNKEPQGKIVYKALYNDIYLLHYYGDCASKWLSFLLHTMHGNAAKETSTLQK